MKMKAIARFGKEFGSYRMVEVPYPTCETRGHYS